jgi:hypothetical protein
MREAPLSPRLAALQRNLPLMLWCGDNMYLFNIQLSSFDGGQKSGDDLHQLRRQVLDLHQELLLAHNSRTLDTVAVDKLERSLLLAQLCSDTSPQ